MSTRPRDAAPCAVLHVSSVHPHDDVRIIYRECAVLRRAGIDVQAAFFDTRGPEVAGVPLLSMGERPRSRLARALIASWRMRRLVKARRPRVVHIHDPELLPLALYLKRRGYIVLYDAHEDLPKQVFHKHWIPAWARRPVSGAVAWLLPHALLRVDGVVVAARHIHDERLMDQQRVVLRNMPVQGRVRVDAERIGFDDRERAVVYIGSITRARRVDATVQGALKAGAVVYLAGRAEEAYLQSLQAMDRERVRYLGVFDPTELESLLARCRVGMALLPPSPAYLEAIPSKLFDYLKAGLPTMYSHFDYWCRDLGEGMAPYKVDPLDVDQIAERLRPLLDDRDAWQRAHRAVIAAAGRYPGADEESAQLVDLYQSLLEGA